MSGPELAIVAGGVAALLLVRAALWLLVSRGGWLVRRVFPAAVRAGAMRRTRRLRHGVRARSPGLYRFVAGRFDAHRFTGLPLTLIAVAAAYLAFLFAGLVEEVMELQELEAADQAIVRAIVPLRYPGLVIAFDWITEFGSMPTLTAVAVVATCFLWAHGPRFYIAPVWLTVLGSQLTTWSGKFIIDRPRPEFELDIEAFSPSFPSGHATGAMAVYGILAYVLSRDLETVRGRFELAFWTAVVIALVAFSRIFISVHHPSDVAAGLIVGCFWLLAGVTLAEVLRGGPTVTRPAGRPETRTAATESPRSRRGSRATPTTESESAD